MIRVAVLWIVNDSNELLLAQRAHHRVQDPGVWGPTVTGKLEAGESFEAALLREVEEEIGLKPSEYEPKFLIETAYVHPDGEQRMFGTFYTVLPRTVVDDLRIDSTEVAGVKWFAMDTVFEMMRTSPQELVPSANAVWPDTFRVLRAHISSGYEDAIQVIY